MQAMMMMERGIKRVTRKGATIKREGELKEKGRENKKEI